MAILHGTICMIRSYLVLKSKELLNGTICMTWFDDSDMQSYKLVYSNSLISISTESTMSDEPAVTATVIAIIPGKKSSERKTK